MSLSTVMICKRTAFALVLCAVALVGCGGSSSSKLDAGVDAGSSTGGKGAASGTGGAAGARVDAGADAVVTDTRTDTGGPDILTADIRPDIAPDLRPDLAGDVQAGGQADVRPDTSTDVPATGDAGPDTAPGSTDSGSSGGDAVSDAAAPSDAGAPEMYVANLSGAEQVPVFDTAATGTTNLTYNPSSHLLTWTLTQNVVGASAAHIHTAGAGEAGAVTFPFTLAAPGQPTTGSATLTVAQENDLRLGHLYVNVHSPGPGANGEIRGQILRPGETLWVAQLGAAEQVPVNNSTGTGTVSLIVNAAHTSGHYRMTTTLTPIAAHLHTGIAGVAGVAGGVVRFTFTITGMTAEDDFLMTADDFTALDQTQLYANIHTTAFPSGEIRGQMLRPGSQLFVSTMTGAQEVPANASTGTGNGSVALDYRSSTARYVVVTSLTPVMAHIHDGLAGISGGVILGFPTVSMNFAGLGALPAGETDALLAGRLYTNVHTTAFMGGEIRGQLLRPAERLFVALLSGANEVPPVTSAASGVVQLVLNAAATSVRYEGAVTGLADATASHIHAGAAGAATGAIIYTLALTGLNPIGAQAVLPADVTALLASTYNLDVHSTANMSGEIRGPITPR